MSILNFLSSVAAGTAAGGLLVWFLRQWISIRLKTSIEHEYNQKLESHKSALRQEQELAILNIKTELSREAAFHAAAHASFAEGQKAAMERKLCAVDRMWDCISQFRANLPPVLTFIDVLTVDEYQGAKDHPTFRELTGDLTAERISGFSPKGIESARPYIGEYMWSVFFCYQAIMLRILFLLHLGRTDAEKIEWHKDTGTRSLIEAVLLPKELEEFDKIEFGKVGWIQRRLDSKLLTGAQKIISGESFGFDSLQQARLIQDRIAEISDHAGQGDRPSTA